MGEWSEILQLNNGPVLYEKSGKGHIKMQNHAFPYSIFEKEFDYIKNLIIEREHIRGYECATAFGVSTMACGLGFKQTRGKLVTMDAYIEEASGNPEVYQGESDTIYQDMDGFKSVKHLIKHFGLQNTVFPTVGWSPRDTVQAVRSVHGDGRLDFAFIDAGHFPKMIMDDIQAVHPLLGPRYTVVFHDVYAWSFTEEVHQFILQLTGKEVKIVMPFPYGENLGIIQCD